MRRCVSFVVVVIGCFSGFFSVNGQANSCDCGSTDPKTPCEGTKIKVEVLTDRSVVFEWGFNSNGGAAYCGKFANGDYWVAPKNSSSVEITHLLSKGSGDVSLDENPKLESIGLLDPIQNYGNYQATENLITSLPVQYNYSTSLVAAVQRDEELHGGCGTKAILGNCADAYNVLTVLNEVPENAGATVLRPSIDEDNKELLSLSSFDFGRLPEKAYFKGPTDAEIELIRQRWSHSLEIFSGGTIDGTIYSEGGRAFRANLLVDDYASGTAVKWYNDLMMLFSDDRVLQEKMPAISAMLVYGKDLYYSHYTQSGVRERSWKSGAGQFTGRYHPAVFFSVLSRDELYGNVLRSTPEKTLGSLEGASPQEIEQVNVGIQTPVWGDGTDEPDNISVNGYWSDVFFSQCFDGATGECNPSLGKKNRRDPYNYIDGPGNKPGTSYMGVTFGPMKSMAATMMLMPEMCEIVNYDELVTYVDRITEKGIHTENDQCAPPDPREDGSVCDVYRDKNCKYYKVTWGPDPANPGQCIKNAPGQNGRFSQVHGAALDYVYKSPQVENNWYEITGGRASCRPLPVKELTSVIVSDVNRGVTPLTVNFNGSYSGSPAGAITQWDWDFGNGVNATGELSTATFDQPGTYNVSLTVTDVNGNYTTTSRVVEVVHEARKGMVLGLSFDGNLLDSSFYDYKASWNGVGPYVDGAANDAASFSPVDNNSITVGHGAELDGMDALSISYWARKNIKDTSSRAITKHSIYASSILSDGVYFYLFTSNGRLDIGANDLELQDTSWHNYTLTYDGAVVKVYIDGVEHTSLPWSGKVVSHSSRPIIIGKDPWGSSFDGDIDELQVYKRALSKEEVVALQLQSEPEEESDLLEGIVLDLGLDSNLVDASETGLLLSWKNHEAYEQGILYDAAAFNPIQNGYITAKHHPNIDGMGAITIDFWARKNDPVAAERILTKHAVYAANVLANGVYFYLFTTDKGRLNISATSEAVKDTDWHQYTLTYDGTMARLYIDAVEKVAIPWSGAIVNRPSRGLIFGKDPWGNAFDGSIDEMHIYNRALSADEVKVIQHSH